MNAASPVETLVTDHLDLWTAALKRKSTAGRGSSSKVELYGIKKLRELILELAVRGLLVPQDPNDEPASELLKKIAAEKAKLVKAGKIKKDKPLPVIDEKETPFTLPSNWTFARWGEIAEWAIGSGFPTEAQGENDQEILFSKVSDMNLLGNEKYIITTVNSISRKTAEKIKAKAHPPGTVVFPKIGGAIATNKRRILVRETAIDNNCLGLTPGAGITTDYLYLLLSSVDLSAYQSGTSVPALSQGNLELIVAGFPPLSEQHRIVAKVDELMALCDQLEQQTDASLSAHQTLVETLLSALTSAADHAQFVSAWQRIAGQFDTLFTTEESIALLKQTILQLAVMGKLVPQDLNEEPAGALLERMEKERRRLLKEGSLKKLPQLPELDPRKRSVALPIGWSWGFIPQVIANDKYAIKRGPFGSAIRKDFFVPTGYKVYEQQHAIRDDFSLGNYYLSEDKFHELKAFEVKPNDIVISCSGTVGRVAVAPPWMEPGVINQALLKLTLNQSALTNDYFKILFPAYYMKTETLSELQGTAQKNMVSVETLKEEAFPLPPLSEQHRIVAKVDELMALCEQLKSRLSDAQTTQLHLADAIVEQAIG